MHGSKVAPVEPGGERLREFYRLKDRGIQLLLVPVPSKAEIYPEKILPGVDISEDDTSSSLRLFYDELRAARSAMESRVVPQLV